MRISTLILCGLLAQAAQAQTLDPNTRPLPRPAIQAETLPQGWATWRRDLLQQARRNGITEDTLRRVEPHMIPRPQVVQNDRNQSEFVDTVWGYLDRFVSETRVARGREMAVEHRQTFQQVQDRFGVDWPIVAAIWGVETNFGTHRGGHSVFQALSTLAFDGRRREFFERELLAAMQIVQNHAQNPETMTGSWAGAMGHTQFMPSSYLAYARGLNGQRGGNIWGDDPADALAAAAAYLRHHGWQQGEPVFVEVRLPQGFDLRQADRTQRSTAFWSEQGVRTLQGNALPQHDKVFLLLPAGVEGPALAVYPNFNVIRRYNPADTYAMAVALVARGIEGRPGLETPWPRHHEPLNREQVQNLQRRLNSLGLDTGGVTGMVGNNTRNAVRTWQSRNGLVPDGHVHQGLYERIMR